MKTLPKMTKEQKELVEQYLGLPYHYKFKRYYEIPYTYYDAKEIYQFFLYALCIAAIKFKPEKGYKFTTYAYSIIGRLVKRQINRDRLLICNTKICHDKPYDAPLKEYVGQYIEPEIFEALFKDNKNSIERIDYSHDIKLEITKLKEAISTLSEEDQMIVKLRYFSGDKVMSYKEMEQHTPGLSYRTLCNRMVKIKQELKKRMSN